MANNEQLQLVNRLQGNGQLQLSTLSDFTRLGEVFQQSGLFSDIKGAAQAVVKIVAGAELGFPPIASMTGIYLVKGRVTLSANLIAAAIKKTKKYNYRVVEMSNKICTIDFFEHGEKCGTSSFNEKDAQEAGLLNTDTWKKFRRNMLFARALTNGARWFTPEIFGGTSVAFEGEGESDPGGDLGDSMPLAPAISTPDIPQNNRKTRLIGRIEQLFLEEDALELITDQIERDLDLHGKTEQELEELGGKISRRIKAAKDDFISRQASPSDRVPF